MTKTTDTAIPTPLLGDASCDPIEDRLRATVRATIEALFDVYLGRIGSVPGGGVAGGRARSLWRSAARGRGGHRASS